MRGARAVRAPSPSAEVCGEGHPDHLYEISTHVHDSTAKSARKSIDVLFLESNLASGERVSERLLFELLLRKAREPPRTPSTIPRVMPGLAVRPVAIERNHSAKPRRNS